ncbi:MAG: beta-lactamase family protein [Gemmatimonadales bacterium]|nr:beta-lactamase family protein [Gemmatimonadales bacterium]
MLAITSFAALSLSAVCSAADLGGARSTDPTRAARLQEALNTWAADSTHYGVSASIILADGTQWSGTAGRGGAGLRLGHLIGIASITKTMTGAVILQLADEGRLTLDDPIRRWLPPRPNIDSGITIRQLLNHTNGLANYNANPALASAVATDSARRFSTDELLQFVGPALFSPGTRTQYTNTSFILLGAIAERVTGKPIVELYRKRLWNPLKLCEIFLPGSGAAPTPVAPALANGVVVSPLGRLSHFSAGHTAYGLMASARAVARWGHALFTGRVVSAQMRQEMRRLVPAAGNIPGESGAGLAIRSYNYLGRTQFGHSGGSPLGSSLLLHDPTSGVTVAVLMNQGQRADHFVLAPRLLEIATQP